MLKRLLLTGLATLSVALAAGCGAGPQAGISAGLRDARPMASAAGKVRKLGYDVDRYRRQQSWAAKPQRLPQAAIPARVDLRADCSPVANQLDLGACTAFAAGKGLREYLLRRAGKPEALSALFLYYETRRLRGTTDSDSGATLTDTLKAMAGAGVAPEALWPYDMDRFALAPSPKARQAAQAFRLASGLQLAGLADIQKALAKRQPVVFGMCVYDTTFEHMGPSGQIAMPQPGDVFVGGHAVTAVGYDNQKQRLIVRNSWGADWGDKGYFYLPYGFMTPENVMDIWTAM